MAMDFAYDKRLIKEFFQNNRNLFFPNDKYPEEFVQNVVLGYCGMLHDKYDQADQRRCKLFLDAGLPTILDWLDIEKCKKMGHSDYGKITDEMKKATSDTFCYSAQMDYFRENILNKSNYKENNLSNCEHLLKDITLQEKYSRYQSKLSYEQFLDEMNDQSLDGFEEFLKDEENYDPSKREKCPNCGSAKSPVEKSVLETKDTMIGIILLLFCFPIGIVYFLVKKGNKQKICPDCGKLYKKI